MTEETLKDWLKRCAVLFTLLFCLIPFAYMALVSVSGHPDFRRPVTSRTLSLEHYTNLITHDSLHFFDYLLNSLVVSGVSALFAVLVAALAAYALTRLSLPCKGAVLLAVLALSLFPQISLVGYLFKLMAALGWINRYPALILPYIAWVLPLSLWILTSYFSQIPPDLDRAALVDGCSRWQVLTRVLIPVAAPGLLSTLLLAFIFAFNEFLFALILTTDYRARTLPVGMALFQGLHGETPWGSVMAAATLATLPLVVLTLAFQRWIVQGLTRGAVKG